MIRFLVRSIVGTITGAAMLSMGAQAETLRISGLYPAQSPGVETLSTIAIDRFGGQDGTELAFAIEDRLTNLSIREQSYFNVININSDIVPDAVMSGTATANIDEYETSGYRQKCVERNDKGKCTKRKSVKVPCLQRVIDFRADVRLSSFDEGRTIYAEAMSRKHDQTVCKRNENFSSSASEIRRMINSIATDVRRDLAPTERTRDIRVLESRKNMSKTEGKLFKAAVKMTKTDEIEACRMWEEAGANSAPHPSLFFNRGLCAEQRGDLTAARGFYDEAAALTPGKSDIAAALKRVQQREQALEQWALRTEFLAASSNDRQLD